MTRSTSVIAYHKIKDEGLLSKRRFEVYDFLYKYGPLTGRELINGMRVTGNTGAYNTRLSELRDQGVVAEIGTKKCQFTGHHVTVWTTTDKLPRPLQREKKSPRSELEFRLKRAEEFYTLAHERMKNVPEWHELNREFTELRKAGKRNADLSR